MASSLVFSYPGSKLKASLQRAASIVGGALPSSWNSAQSNTWSVTLFPRTTARPFAIRSGSPSGSSDPFSYISSHIRVKCTVLPFRSARFLTSAASSTNSSFHVPRPFPSGQGMLRSLFHSASSAALNFGLVHSDLGTFLATQAG